MNKALATTVQQREDIPVTTTHLSQRAHRPWPPQTVQLIKLGLHLFQCLPCWISPLLALPQLDAHLPDSLSAPHRKVGLLFQWHTSVINATSRPMSTPKRLRLGVNTALQRVMRTCPNWHWRLGPAPNHKGRNLPVPLPVQPRPPLILAMVQWWEPQGALGIRTVRATPTTVGPHLTWMHPERNVATLGYGVKPPGTVSCVQTQMR